MIRRFFLISSVFLLGTLNYLTLSGCSSVVLAATDPRSISTTTEDQYVKRQLAITYMGSEFESDHVEVNAYNHEILLTGQASSYMQQYKIIRTARKASGVTKVYDYLNVSSAKYVSTLSNDTVITAKVKSQLFGKGNVNSNDVQVVTANGGVVYYLGIIKKEQLDDMISVAKSVDGVKNVVPLVHYKKSDTKLNLPIGNS